MNAQIFPSPKTGIDWLFITGNEASIESGDDDHIQSIYLLIPDSIEDLFKIEISVKEEYDSNLNSYSHTEESFELRIFGNQNVYLPKEYSKYLLEQPEYSINLSKQQGNTKLLTAGIAPNSGEYRPELKSWLFRIEIAGLEGSDSMHYKLKLQPEKIFLSHFSHDYFYSNNLSFLLPENPIRFCFFIPDEAAGMSFEFFDMDNDGKINFTSNRRKGQKAFPSGNGEYRRAMLNIFSDEKNDSLCLKIKDSRKQNNNISLYWLLEDVSGKDISMPFEYSEIPGKNRKKKNHR